MLKIWFCGYNGFDMLQRVNKLSQHHHNDKKLSMSFVDSEKVKGNSAITRNKSMRVLKPEEILVPLEEGAIWTCSVTLKEITLFKSSGNDESFSGSFFSSLKVEEETGKFAGMCTVRDKILTIFDDKAYLNNDEFLAGEKIYTVNSSVLHIGGTDSTIVFVEEKKLTLIKIAPVVSPAIDLPLDLAVAAVYCGKEHILLQTSRGAVYSFGGGSRGQLGLGDMENRDRPCLLDELTGVWIMCIAAGGWHSMAVSDLGDLYVWGWNESGQLGLPCRNVSTQQPPPEKEHNYQRASPDTADKSGAWFTPVYLEKIESDQCQVHIQRVGAVQIQPLPSVLDLGDDVCVVKVACGSRHSAVVTADSQLLTSGWNDYGQLCHGDIWSRDYFQTVDYFLQHKLTVNSVFCGPWSTLVLTGKCKLNTWIY